MKNNSNKMSSFTLIELILVLILVGVIYAIFLPKFNTTTKNQDKKIELKTLKKYLLENFDFQESIKFSCIEKDFTCYVIIDNAINEDVKIENFFNVEPEILTYNKNLDRYDLGKITVDGFTENLIFEYKINSDFKSNEFILDTKENKVYLFNSIYENPLVFDSVFEVRDYIDKNINGVKGAF